MTIAPNNIINGSFVVDVRNNFGVHQKIVSGLAKAANPKMIERDHIKMFHRNLSGFGKPYVVHGLRRPGEKKSDTIGRAIRYGPLSVALQQDNTFSIYHDEADAGFKHRWFRGFEGFYSHTFAELWNRPIEVESIVYAGQWMTSPYRLFCVPSFTVLFGVGPFEALKRAGVERVKLMTFGDPFLSVEDRFAYMAEFIT